MLHATLLESILCIIVSDHSYYLLSFGETLNKTQTNVRHVTELNDCLVNFHCVRRKQELRWWKVRRSGRNSKLRYTNILAKARQSH